MFQTRIWASIALAFTIVAGAASIALIVLNAIAVKDGPTDGEKASKTKIIGAQLAFGIIELLLCIDYLVIYTVVGIVASTTPHDWFSDLIFSVQFIFYWNFNKNRIIWVSSTE